MHLAVVLLLCGVLTTPIFFYYFDGTSTYTYTCIITDSLSVYTAPLGTFLSKIWNLFVDGLCAPFILSVDLLQAFVSLMENLILCVTEYVHVLLNRVAILPTKFIVSILDVITGFLSDSYSWLVADRDSI